MKHFGLALVAVCVAGTVSHGGEPGVKETIAYVKKLQTSTGGFLAQAPAANVKAVPTLRATSSAVRALHYLGGDLPNKKACIQFVESCHDPVSGGFADMPRGKPDVFLTAVGLMAVTELKMPTDKYAKGAIPFLSENSKNFDDIRIAAAGLERLQARSPRNDAWLSQVIKTGNGDDTYGAGAAQARATGSAVVTVLRLGGKLADAKRVLKVLNDGQHQNGGWGKGEDETSSDLETTYRIMRCYHMLKARPGSVEGVRSFVAKCRNADGGYGIAPGQPSNIGGTYFASIVLHWLKESK